MTVYIDEPSEYYNRKNWCHMMTDSNDLDELHQMAIKIGLRRQWFQPKSSPHYDLSPSKQHLALAHGAIRVTRKELVKICVLGEQKLSIKGE